MLHLNLLDSRLVLDCLGMYGVVEVLLSVGGEVGGGVVVSEVSVCQVKCVLSHFTYLG